MPEVKEVSEKKDLHFIDLNDKTEIDYLHSKYPWISEQEIRLAVKEKGPERKHVEDFLDRYHK